MKAKLPKKNNIVKVPRKVKKKAKLFIKKQQETKTGCKVKIKLICVEIYDGIFTYNQRTYLNKKIKIKK